MSNYVYRVCRSDRLARTSGNYRAAWFRDTNRLFVNFFLTQLRGLIKRGISLSYDLSKVIHEYVILLKGAAAGEPQGTEE